MLGKNEIVKTLMNCSERFDIKNAYLFGSYASGDQTENSDLDLLVEFGPNVQKSWGGPSVGLSCELEDALGISVDVIKLPLAKDSYLILESVVKCFGSESHKTIRTANA
ncbi:MAG: nucleotidyltransferase domain-containing protein [Clostridiales bacterium]|nr:nucleotidyltransferase domain-containing protein [Clostridiales bacterium]